MPIIKTNPVDYGPFQNHTSFTKDEFIAFKKFILIEFSGKYRDIAIENKSLGFSIHINYTGLRHGLNKGGSIDKTKVVTIIDKLLRDSLLYDMAASRDNPNYKVFFLQDVVNIDGKIWKIRLVVKETVEGYFYYHHDLIKISRE